MDSIFDHDPIMVNVQVIDYYHPAFPKKGQVRAVDLAAARSGYTQVVVLFEDGTEALFSPLQLNPISDSL